MIKRRKYTPNVKTVITISCLRPFYRVTFFNILCREIIFFLLPIFRLIMYGNTY